MGPPWTEIINMVNDKFIMGSYYNNLKKFTSQ